MWSMPDLESASSEPKRTPPVVTLAALYGTGGVVIGPQVAQRLGVAFLDRAIPASVAAQTGVPEEVVAAADEPPAEPQATAADTAGQGAQPDSRPTQERWLLEEGEMRAEIAPLHGRRRPVRRGGAGARRRDRAARGAAGAARVPGRAPAGPYRAGRGCRRQSTEPPLSGAWKTNDWARREYVRRAYGVDGDDPALYHLVIDATAFGVDACVELIVAAATLHVTRSTDATT